MKAQWHQQANQMVMPKKAELQNISLHPEQALAQKDLQAMAQDDAAVREI